jgi:dTDP-4-amino-4,6-dideoxygalactose transaminase
MVNFPKPHIPISPVLSLESFGGDKDQHVPSVLDAGGARFVTSGKRAIALALRQMKIGKNDKVLLPAYHCIAMVKPVIQENATPVFYKINSDTSVDLDDIQARLDDSIKLLLVVHYFGFPQNLSKIRIFCDEHNILLLEDCAHCFFGEHDGRPIGSFGDYAIASTIKFFPTYEGGCLVSSRHSISSLHLESDGVAFEIRATLNTLERGFEYGRLGFLQKLIYLPMCLKNFIWGHIKKRVSSENIDYGPEASYDGFAIEERWRNKRSSFFSQYLIKKVSQSRIVTRRRENYLTLLEALSGLPGCHPLFDRLPDGVIPYVFPLIVEEPEKFFKPLKNLGIPVIRFGEFLWHSIDANIYPVSTSLSKQVFQFPCHQELTSAELNWMIKEIRSVFLSNRHIEE